MTVTERIIVNVDESREIHVEIKESSGFNTAIQVRNSLSGLTGDDRLDVSAIKNVPAAEVTLALTVALAVAL
jgi:hypothetical protein